MLEMETGLRIRVTNLLNEVRKLSLIMLEKKQDCGMNLIIIYPQNCVSNYVYCVSSSMCETRITQEGHADFAVVKNWLHPHPPANTIKWLPSVPLF
jgi:hypothetical protein